MDKDQVKGAVNDAAGRVKRQVGEWTGDTNAQVEGAAQQIKGKAQKAWGDVKDAAHDTGAKIDREHEREVGREQEREREKEHANTTHGQR
jgi:uncharacterized protein YjbJ (UPF0337 family)